MGDAPSATLRWIAAWHAQLANDHGILSTCLKCTNESPGPTCPWCDPDTWLRMAESLSAADNTQEGTQ